MHFVYFSGVGFADTAAGEIYIYTFQIKLKLISIENKITDL